MGSLISYIAPYQKGTAVAVSAAILGASYLLPDANESHSSLVNLGHLGCFGVWFGTQFWVTFVAGLTKLAILPRHWFAKVQRVLFDHYFLTGFVLNSVMLATFVMKHPFTSWEGQTLYMGNVLLASSLFVGTNCFFIKPWVTNTGIIMNDYEAARGYGEDPGSIKEGDILEDPNYIAIKKNFITAHAASALVNMFNLAFSGFHLWYLASHISF